MLPIFMIILLLKNTKIQLISKRLFHYWKNKKVEILNFEGKYE